MKSNYDIFRNHIRMIDNRNKELKRLGLSKTHPHKFRRTLATIAIDKGMLQGRIQ